MSSSRRLRCARAVAEELFATADVDDEHAGLGLGSGPAQQEAAVKSPGPPATPKRVPGLRRGLMRQLVAEVVSAHALRPAPSTEGGDQSQEAAGEASLCVADGASTAQRDVCTDLVVWAPPQCSAPGPLQRFCASMSKTLLLPMCKVCHAHLVSVCGHILGGCKDLHERVYVLKLVHCRHGRAQRAASTGASRVDVGTCVATGGFELCLASAVLRLLCGAGCLQPVIFLEFERCDETPMKLRHRTVVPPLPLARERVGDEVAVEAILPFSQHRGLAASSQGIADGIGIADKHVRKLLQVDSSWAAVFRTVARQHHDRFGCLGVGSDCK